MKIIPGKRANNIKEATNLVWLEIGANDISYEVTSLFASMVDAHKLHQETEKTIDKVIGNRYRNSTSWHKEWWHVPIPQLRFDSRDVPRIVIEVPIYLVGVVEVKTATDYFIVTLIEALGRPETLVIPMVFLQAILDEDLGRFKVLARSGNLTTWEIPGMNPQEMPNEFLNQLAKVLLQKSVVDWLHSFGVQGRSIAPLVAGTLLGLLFANPSQAVPLGQEGWSAEQLISIAEGMAYKPKEAKDMVNRALPFLRSEHTLEDATKILLQQAGKGG
jgi:hypothetical protein